MHSGVASVLHLFNSGSSLGSLAARAGGRPRGDGRQFVHRPANPTPQQTLNPAPGQPYFAYFAGSCSNHAKCPRLPIHTSVSPHLPRPGSVNSEDAFRSASLREGSNLVLPVE
jgi:hypothetical protein